MHENALLYFVKYPEPGRVKTRLAKTVGGKQAADLYREAAERNLAVLAQAGESFHLIAAYDPPEREAEIREWLGKATNVIPAKAGIQRMDSRLKRSGMTIINENASISYWPQKGSGLGARLQNAFQFAFEKGFKKVMALGSDTQDLTKEIVEEAFKRLERFDIVLGPARDGGYYLIGLSHFESHIFKNIPWSTPAVLEVTLAKIKEQKLSYDLLGELEDLDDQNNLRGGQYHEIFK